MVRLSMVCPYPHGLRLSVISSLMYSTRYSDFIGYGIRDKHRIKNKIVEQDFVPLKAVNAKTKFVEAGKRKIAYSSIGKGLPIWTSFKKEPWQQQMRSLDKNCSCGYYYGSSCKHASP